MRPRSATLLSKYREFQFMLLHGIIYTKEQLLRFGFVENNLCLFCNQEIETYKHLFLSCQKVNDIWKEMIEYYDLFEIRNMNWDDIHVGLCGNSARVKFVNSLIIFMKYVIFKSRNAGKLLTFNEFGKKLLEYMEEEKKIASRRGKLVLHLLKWEYAN